MDNHLGAKTFFYEVYFKAQDINLISDSAKEIRSRVYQAEGATELEINGEVVKVADKTNQAGDGWKLFESESGKAVDVKYDDQKDIYYYPLVSGKEYYIQVPLVGVTTGEINLSETKSVNLYVEVQSIVQKFGRKNESAYVYDSFELSQMNLFDLD